VKRDRGLGIRVLVRKADGAATGFSYLTDLSRNATTEAAKRAIAIARVRKADKDLKSFQMKAHAGKVGDIFDRKVVRTDASDLVEVGESMLKESSSDPRVSTVSGNIYSSVSHIALTNSLGVSVSYRSTAFGGNMYVVTESNGSVGVGWESHSSTHYDQEKMIHVAKDAVDIAARQLKPKPIQSGSYDLVVDQEGFADLLMNTFVQELRADLVQKNQSPLAGRTGSESASGSVSFIDDPSMPRLQGSKPFDTEGCPTKPRTIVDKGILRGFLHNSYTSNKENTENTGNAMRYIMFGAKSEYALEPITGPHNLILKPDKGIREDLVREVRNGIYVRGFIGAHTSNVQSGDFSVAMDCMLKIENGELTHPIKQAMIGGNMPAILRQIRVVGGNSKQVIMGPRMTLYAPTILIEGVTVSA
jgi:PmbA protein